MSRQLFLVYHSSEGIALGIDDGCEDGSGDMVGLEDMEGSSEGYAESDTDG